MRKLITFSLVLLLLPVAAGHDAEDADTMERLVVDLSETTPGALAAATAEAAPARVVREDTVLAFAVVEAADADAFARALDAPVTGDARGGGGALAHVPDDDHYPRQWGPTELNMPQAWVAAPTARSVTVAVVDSGIDPDHPDLRDAPLVFGKDYVDGDGDPFDQHGHGTHVAGIIGATRDNGYGIAGIADSELLVIRVLDARNRGWCSDFASGIREAVDAGADVINLSLWCSVDSHPLRDAVAYATARGVLVVGITGNEQVWNPGACVTYPGRYDDVLATAALDPTLTPAAYSCRGPEAELAAPGTLVYATYPGDSFAFISGTSMAAPHVAGVAALVKAAEPWLDGDGLRERLTETATDLGIPGRDSAYGHGMVNPVEALTGAPIHGLP